MKLFNTQKNNIYYEKINIIMKILFIIFYFDK